jgi:hypothetical protein
MKNMFSYLEPELSFSENLKIVQITTPVEKSGKFIYFQITGDIKAFIVSEIIFDTDEEFAFGVEAINTLIGRAITLMNDEDPDATINLSFPRSLTENFHLLPKNYQVHQVDFFQQQFFIKTYIIEEKIAHPTIDFNSIRKEIEQCSQSLNF